MDRFSLLKFSNRSVEMVLGVHCTRSTWLWWMQTITNWKLSEKTNLLPILSLSALSPLPSSTAFILPFPPVLHWSEILEEQQAFPVCFSIIVCDFSLTSQAALWHGGVIVNGGWKPFCYGRVDKDKAVPQQLCLDEHCGLVSPAW